MVVRWRWLLCYDYYVIARLCCILYMRRAMVVMLPLSVVYVINAFVVSAGEARVLVVSDVGAIGGNFEFMIGCMLLLSLWCHSAS